MKIWQIQIPFESGFAELLSIYKEPDVIRCDKCFDAPEPNLLVEWEDGSDIIADFITASGRVVVKESVADEMLYEFKGFKKSPIHFLDHQKLYKPKKVTKRTPKRVWLPYTGPPICELSITKEVPFHEKSTVVIEERCDACGSIVYEEFEGIEIKNSHEHTPRKKGMGLYFKESDLAGYDFFKPKYTGLVLCTDRVKSYIENKKYTNIEFLEIGETV